MFGKLTPTAVESLLHAEIFARIGYVDRNGLPHIVPISYAYDGRALYGYSLMGAKIKHMTVNPRVCVQVDHIENAADWSSVTARGLFHALGGSDAAKAVERILERLRTYAAATGAPAKALRTFVERMGGAGIAYRIDITDKQGRYSGDGSVLNLLRKA